METFIIKRLKPTEIVTLFENTNNVNIRYFEMVNNNIEYHVIPNNVYTFNVKVRHNENEDPNKVFNKALKELRKTTMLVK